MRRKPFMFAAAAAIVAAATSCALVSEESTESRMKRQFGLSDVESTEAIRAGLLQRVPIGSSEGDIVAFLKTRGVGQDPLSGYEFDDGGAAVLAYIDRDRSNRWHLVQFDYAINFKLDEHRALKDVIVTRVGTGP
jgi:hypothetical protein